MDVTVFPVRAAHLDAIIERGTTWRLSYALWTPSPTTRRADALVPGDHVVTGETIDVVHSVTPTPSGAMVEVRFGTGQWWELAVTVKVADVFQLAEPASVASVLAAYEYDYPLVIDADGTTTGGPLVVEIPSSTLEDGSVALELPVAVTWALPDTVGQWDMTLTLDDGSSVRVLEGQWATVPTVSGTPLTPAPSLLLLAPSNIPDGTIGGEVVVTGEHFDPEVILTVNGEPHSTIFDGPTSLRAPILGREVPGAFPVQVTNPDGQVSNTLDLTVQALDPVYELDWVQPDSGPGDQLITVTVAGQGFAQSDRVWAGDQYVQPSEINPTGDYLRFGMPVGPPGMLAVWVESSSAAMTNHANYTREAPSPPTELEYNLTANTTPPTGPGIVCFERTQTDVGTLWLSLVDANAVDRTVELATLDVGWIVRLIDIDDVGRWQDYYVIAPAVVTADYVELVGAVHWNQGGPELDVPSTVTVTTTPPA